MAVTRLASTMVGRIQELWGRLNPIQRWLFLGLGGALVAAIVIGSYINRPEWVVLVSDVEPRDAAAVVARLNELKVPFRPSGDGNTILVQKSDRYAARLALDQAGLPKGVSVGMELFDEPKFGATEFDRRVNHLRAQQGELERALMRISDIEYANVKLAIPEQSVFVREQQPVTASVLVQPRPAKGLSQEQVLGIITFVSSSVQGLTGENVQVVDHNGRLLSTFALDAVAVVDDDQLERQRQLQRELEHRAQSLVEAIFGSGNVVARVSLQVDMESTRTESQTIGDAVPKRTESVRDFGAGGTGQNGLPSGDPTVPPVYQGQGTTPAGESWRSQTATDYEFSQRMEVTVRAPGAVKNITVGIAINRESLSTEQVRQIQETVARATGAEVAGVSVVAMPFQLETTPTITPSAPQTASTDTLVVLLGIAAALMLIAFVITRLRRPQLEPEFEMAFAGVPAARAAPGSMMDVALGRRVRTVGEERPLEQPEPFEPPTRAEMRDTAEVEDQEADEKHGQPEKPTLESMAIKTVRRRLESAMISKTTRHLELSIQPVDAILMAHVANLIDTSPEASAEVLRQWLKGTPKLNQVVTGREKAAIFSINIGADQSGKVLRHLRDDEVELLTLEVAQAKKVSSEVRDDVFQEFVETATSEQYIRVGGVDYAKSMLEQAMGVERAGEILHRLEPNLRRRPFDSIRKTDPAQLAGFLHQEHPQTIAAVMAHLAPEHAVVMLTNLSPEQQSDVLRRVSKLDRTSPEMLREVERVLEKKLTSVGSQETTEAGGIPWAVDVLNRVDRSTERSILEQLAVTDPDLVAELSQLMFLFDDIVKLDDRAVQRVLRDVDMSKDLPLALKGAKEEVWSKIMKNLSRRAAQNLSEAVDILGLVRIREVEESQARIVGLIRQLEEKGEIDISRGAVEDEFI